jgi:hypothetical protein
MHMDKNMKLTYIYIYIYIYITLYNLNFLILELSYYRSFKSLEGIYLSYQVASHSTI